ncbi:uncharacterized protein ANIA_11389 [Aspergillus nidulans FGSC A4]|uniref:Uncharacterized protein n=1 Tax=Emericella nidulans (strain FGSC A4 / ATCC 38163 / CBS 112.46 / NRRL 194 / M139) TaxID=227321 RepID=C8VHV8_EMENI|nr:hypothetical protein [Aspergillus nidulans FGSC A4]CBF82924.1 TPA: hypothetical protein ANIA_11389 [Aspergillus nidulans FGSC A4]
MAGDGSQVGATRSELRKNKVSIISIPLRSLKDIGEKKREFTSGYLGCGTMARVSRATPAGIARQFRKEMSLEEGVDVVLEFTQWATQFDLLP